MIRVTVPHQDLADGLADVGPDVEVAVWDLRGSAPWPTIDIVVPPYMGAVESLDALQDVEVRYVQIQSIGYDGHLERIPAGGVLCNAAGVHEGPTAELGMALILAAQRDLARYVRQQQAQVWSADVTRGMHGLRVVVVGAGGVAGALADRLEPFGTIVTRVGRTARTDERGTVAATEELPALLAQADVVVLCVPLDDSTRGMADAEFLRRMRDGALLVNLARGPVVDTSALLAELGSGRLRAALDVVDPEPLPEGHPLWTARNLLLSPHVGGRVSTMGEAVVALLRQQIDAVRSGREPRNIIR